MITKENLSLKIHTCGLRSSHIVKYSCNLIKPTQASQWINFMHNGVGLGKAVMVMMWMMCERLEVEKSSGENLRGNRSKEQRDFYMEVNSLIVSNDKLEKSSGIEIGLLSSDDMVEKSKELANLFIPSFKGNSFLTSDKINVMSGSFIRKLNGVYFNYDGDIYLNEGFDKICIFEKEGKERSVGIGSGTFGKLEIIPQENDCEITGK